MALNTVKCNHLTPLGLKGLNDTKGVLYTFTQKCDASSYMMITVMPVADR